MQTDYETYFAHYALHVYSTLHFLIESLNGINIQKMNVVKPKHTSRVIWEFALQKARRNNKQELI